MKDHRAFGVLLSGPSAEDPDMRTSRNGQRPGCIEILTDSDLMGLGET